MTDVEETINECAEMLQMFDSLVDALKAGKRPQYDWDEYSEFIREALNMIYECDC